MPAASRFPNGSRQRERDAEARPGEGREAAITTRRADEPELLADDREDHVRVRLREEVDLLDALRRARSPVMPPEPDARSSPAPTGTPRPRGPAIGSRKLKTRARRYGSIQIATAPSASANVPATASSRSGRPETRRTPATIRQSAIVVPRSGSSEDQPAEERDHEADRLHQLAHRPRHRTAGEHGRHPDAEGELRELRRLKARRAEEEPAPRAVDRRRQRRARRRRAPARRRAARVRAVADGGSRAATGRRAGRRPRARRAPCLTRKRIGSPSPIAAAADVALKTITSPNATRPSVTRTSTRCSSCRFTSDQVRHEPAELLAARLEVVELVEARAGGREQDDVARARRPAAASRTAAARSPQRRYGTWAASSAAAISSAASPIR